MTAFALAVQAAHSGNHTLAMGNGSSDWHAETGTLAQCGSEFERFTQFCPWKVMAELGFLRRVWPKAERTANFSNIERAVVEA